MPNTIPALSAAQIEQFVTGGYVRIDNAFPAELAAECASILWADTGVDPELQREYVSYVLGEGDETAQLMIAVGPSPEDLKSQIDFGWCEFRFRHETISMRRHNTKTGA